MYTAYFGLDEEPFNITPDPRFFFAKTPYKEAYASLCYGIGERKGFIVLTGEVGTGKTTLLRMLMANLEATTRAVFFYRTTLTFEEFLTFLCDELGIQGAGEGRLQRLQALNDFLLAQSKRGITVVLLIDEAQNLDDAFLENLRLLSNLETPTEKLLQIVLVGQPELEKKLDQPSMRQLKQRIALQRRLERLDPQEVGAYIAYRLQMAGCERKNLFASPAIRRIALYSQGIPRLINTICDNALLNAYGASRQTVTAEMIDEVAADHRLEAFALVSAEGPLPALAARRSEPKGWGQRRGGKVVAGRRRRRVWIGVATLLVLIVLGQGVAAFAFLADTHLSQLPGHMVRLVRQAGTRLEAWTGQLSTQLAEVFSGTAEVEPTPAALATAAVPARPAPSPQAPLPAPAVPQAVSTPVPEPKPVVARLSTPSLQPVRETAHPLQQAVAMPTPSARRASEAVPEPLRAVAPEEPSVSATGELPPGHLLGKAANESPSPVSTARPGRSIVLPPATTIGGIAATVYNWQNCILPLDLIAEANPHILDINVVRAGEVLHLPHLTRDTLLRAQPDGTYHLILASPTNAQHAQSLSQKVQEKGYTANITLRRVSGDRIAFRVTIVGLPTLEAGHDAWNRAQTQHWIVSSEKELFWKDVYTWEEHTTP
jgi:general secretion pathway protein A